MTRRVYWGLGVLAILIIGVSAVLLLWDIEPKLLKKPPPGETYTTGHVDGEELNNKLIKMQRRNHQYGPRVVEERLYYDGNFTIIVNEPVPVVRYKEKLKYHLDHSPLFFDLASLVEDEFPKELITYRKGSLKYVDLYPSDSWYSRWKSHTTEAIQNISFYWIFYVQVSIEVPPLPKCSDCVLPPYIEPLLLPLEFSLDKPCLSAVGNASK